MPDTQSKDTPPPEELRFSVDAALVDRLGLELVAKQETAVAELIKNAYDADATRVTVLFEGVQTPGGRLTVEDDGHGMTRQQIERGFLRISTSDKADNEYSPTFQRRRAGRKGIGRFATQRLGHRLVMSTSAANSDRGYELQVDWDRFKARCDLNQVPVHLSHSPARDHSGTTLVISNLRDRWTDAQIRRVFRHVLTLMRPELHSLIDSPDDVALTEAQRQAVVDAGNVRKRADRFSVEFLWERSDDEIDFEDPTTMILDHAVAHIEAVVDLDGIARVRFSSPRYGIDRWLDVHSDDGKAWPELAGLVHARAAYIIQSPKLIPKLYRSRLRALLNESGGFRVYRKGFRILPYGNHDNDWLGLDLLGRQRTFLPPIANNNWLGAVALFDPPDGEPAWVETSSREGLLEGHRFDTLRQLLRSIAQSAAQTVAEVRHTKIRTSDRPSKERGDAVKRAQERAAKLKEDTERLRERGLQGDAADQAQVDSLLAGIAQQANELATDTEEAAAETAEMLGDADLLRILAAMGLLIGEFTHEIRHLLLDATSAIAQLTTAERLEQLPAATRQLLEQLQSTLTSLKHQAAYFDRGIAGQASREVAPQDMRRVLGRFLDTLRSRATKHGIQLAVEPRGADLYTTPMHEAEWLSVLFNLYTNAERAVLASGGFKAIAIECRRSRRDDSIVVRFSDTGTGVKPEVRDRIFDAFVTTSHANTTAPDGTVVGGTGLGLHILRMIVEARNGSIRLLDEPQDRFTTTFEVRIPAGSSGEA